MKKFHEIASDEQGSVLITVLIITLIVALFIGAVLGGIYLQSSFIQQDINRTKALYKAEQNIYRYLQLGSSLDSLGVVRSLNYGGFLVVHSSAEMGNQEVKIEALMGAIPDSVFNYAISLKDTNSALNITGNTLINGDVATGSNQVSTSTFKGFPFRGTFDGEAKKKNMLHFFPEFNAESIEYQLEKFESFFEEDLNRFSANGFRDLSDSKDNDTLFFEGSQDWEFSEGFVAPNKVVVIVNGNLTIEGSGNLGTYASYIVKDTLRLRGGIQGTHALLSAGKIIELSGEVSLFGQVLSRGKIELSGTSYLRYPSLVYSSSETYLGDEKEVIHLKDQSAIDGMVLYPVETRAFNQEQFRIKIDEGATVRGGVYNVGQTELDGSVFGSVLTRQFYFYESPTTYINWLKDAEVDYSKRPQNYVIPIGFSDSTKFELLDWRVKQ